MKVLALRAIVVNQLRAWIQWGMVKMLKVLWVDHGCPSLILIVVKGLKWFWINLLIFLSLNVEGGS